MQESPAEIELEKALLARSDGNEGMARVLARRAAGLAIRAFLQNRGEGLQNYSLNQLIKEDTVRSLLPQNIHAELNRLCTRVNEAYQLPADIDLVTDAKKILEKLNLTGVQEK